MSENDTMHDSMNCVLIKMGGNGVRFGLGIPKQFYEIKGEPLFAYVLRKYEKVTSVDKYIIVTNKEWFELTEKYAQEILGDKLLRIVSGGTTNAKSTYCGIEAARQLLKEEDILLVHDVTDPIINADAIESTIDVAKKYGCAGVITEQVHTLYTKDKEGYITGTIEKSTVGSGYSPEAFKFSVIDECFKAATEKELNTMTSAMAMVLAKGFKPQTVVSHQVDIKITYREDMNALISLIDSGEKLYLKEEL